MTSSLVGSEMCIRDRLASCAAKQRACCRLLRNCPEAPGACGRVAQTSCCLLYTSDAADECRS
eukprot:1062679-Prorocentrum_lima.AAC.1